MRERLARLIALFTLVVMLTMAVLFGAWQQARMPEVSDDVDPARWAEAYPQHYASFMRTAEGSPPYDKLAANPFRTRAWAGLSFSEDYNDSRGHFYALIDQQQSLRTRAHDVPAGCINCHAAEAPVLLREFGWEGLHAMPYDSLRERLHHGSSCADCHDPKTMALTITRPALRTALRARNIDPDNLDRQAMRTYVCAQCHVEYYFSGEGKQLVFPWREGTRLEDMERYFDAIDHADWIHAETGAPMIKIQHPEYELHSQGPHAREGVSCVDCHMPKVRVDGRRISDHWIRSPLAQIENACLDCHDSGEDRLKQRVVAIQGRTETLLGEAETALSALMDAIVDAMQAGANETTSEAALKAARRAHRSAQLRWDFVDAENSTGFHAPQESARLLVEAAGIARSGVEMLNYPARVDALWGPGRDSMARWPIPAR